jgi:hypothetical protein
MVHIENIDYLKKEILTNNGTLYSMKDENVNYVSLFEYVYFCIKYLLLEEDSFQYKMHIESNINKTAKLDINLLNKYKEMFNFIE